MTASNPRSQLHLHLHPHCADQVWPELHLHLHPVVAASGPSPAPDSPVPPRTISGTSSVPPPEPEVRERPKLEFSVLQVTYPPSGEPVLVNTSGGTTGYIGACGYVTDNVMRIDRVYAKIVDADPGTTVPSTLPALFVTPVRVGDQYHWYFGNIPNASTVATNWLVIYARGENGSIRHIDRIPFTGIAENYTLFDTSGSDEACDDAFLAPQIPRCVEIRASEKSTASAAPAGPLRIAMSRPIRLEFHGASPSGRGFLWEPGCRENAGGDWQLVVEPVCGGRRKATLVLKSVCGAKLPLPIVWESDAWTETASTLLKQVSYTTAGAGLPELLVEPCDR